MVRVDGVPAPELEGIFVLPQTWVSEGVMGDPARPRHQRLVWEAPPRDELPGVIPLEAVLAQSMGYVLSIPWLGVYTQGIVIPLVVTNPSNPESTRPRAADWFPSGSPAHLMQGRLTDSVLRFGVISADGRYATNLYRPLISDVESTMPDGPILLRNKGSGNDMQFIQQYWLWPLPTMSANQRSRLTFAVEWPSHGIELSAYAIDQELIDAAARRVQKL